VPLLIRVPGVKPGRIANLACALDIAPAISELAGLSRQPEMQGLSLRQPKKSLACDDVESYPKSYPDVGLGPPGWQTGGFERGSA
jgi:arylsulfatase A-like enzyme